MTKGRDTTYEERIAPVPWSALRMATTTPGLRREHKESVISGSHMGAEVQKGWRKRG